MEKFFEAGTLTQEELRAGPGARPTRAGKIFPLVCTSGAAQHRRRSRCSTPLRRLPALARPSAPFRPSARRRDRSTPSGRRRRRRTPPSCGRRWPIRSRAASRCSASCRARSRPTRPCTTSRGTRPSGSATCSLLQGKTQTHVPEIQAGDLGAVAKLKDTQHQRHARRQGAPASRSRRSPFPEPVLSYAIEPKSRGDEDKISTAHAPARGGRPDHPLPAATRRPTSCCCRARASCTSRSRSPS